jgi:hypothetical protein
VRGKRELPGWASGRRFQAKAKSRVSLGQLVPTLALGSLHAMTRNVKGPDHKLRLSGSLTRADQRVLNLVGSEVPVLHDHRLSHV